MIIDGTLLGERGSGGDIEMEGKSALLVFVSLENNG